MFPFPGQRGAPFFDGKNVSKFFTNWEDLTIGWAPAIKVRKIPLYCEDLVGKYIRTLDTYQEVDRRAGWKSFKKSMLAEFKDEDQEQLKCTEAYLKKASQDIKNRKNASAADYRAFALDFFEKSDYLVKKRIISEYKRVILFLQAFSNKIGNRLCKKHNIDMEDPDTDNVFAELKRDALDLCCDDDSQMAKMWKKEQEPEVHTTFQPQRERQDCQQPQHQPQQAQRQPTAA